MRLRMCVIFEQARIREGSQFGHGFYTVIRQSRAHSAAQSHNCRDESMTTAVAIHAGYQ